MEEQKFSFSETFSKSKEYLETQFELAKLKTISRMARIFGSLVVDASKVLLMLLIIFFFSLALGFYLGELLGSYSLGFLATGGIFFVFLALIKTFEPKLEAKFMDFSIKRILSKWDDDDDETENYKASQDPEPSVEDELKEELEQEVNKENQGV